MTYRILTFFLFPVTLLGQITSNDYFPLRVGNSWAYSYYRHFSDQLMEFSSNTKGIVSLSIQSSIITSDSILWRFQQVRQIHYNQSTAPPNYTSDSGSVIDTLFFDMIEYRTNAHRIMLPDENNEYVPFIFLQRPFSDSVYAFRYYPSETPDTLLIADTLMIGWNPACAFIVSIKKGVGVINGSYYNSMYVGFSSDGYDTLLNAVTSVEQKNSAGLPQTIVLSQNYPNPFNPVTVIPFTLSVRSRVSFRIYNILGCVVDTIDSGLLEAGFHSITWNASRLSSGVYFCLLNNNYETKSLKLVLIK